MHNIYQLNYGEHDMSIKVNLVNEKTGEIKSIKIGWSWTLFFFSGFLGIPLFLRKLYIWGGVFFFFPFHYYLSSLYFVVNGTEKYEVIGHNIGIFIIGMSVQILMAKKGNEMTAKNYLENGWAFEENDEYTKIARDKWKLPKM